VLARLVERSRIDHLLDEVVEADSLEQLAQAVHVPADGDRLEYDGALEAGELLVALVAQQAQDVVDGVAQDRPLDCRTRAKVSKLICARILGLDAARAWGRPGRSAGGYFGRAACGV